MFEFIRNHQLDIMLILCGSCGVLVLLLLNTRFLPRRRKLILILMELMAFFLLFFDREAYIYAGDPSHMGYVMVRVSNFIVFFLTSGIVLGFNLYVTDWLTNEGKLDSQPRALTVTAVLSCIWMGLAVVSAFTDFYYYFDETNTYHRGNGFLISYIIPVLCPLIQFVVVSRYRKVFSRLIFLAIVPYTFIPILCGILQIFSYGISIVNMAMVAVSISMYIFSYIDINNTVEKSHDIEIRHMQSEQDRMQKLFDQTATAFVSAVEKKDDYLKGVSIKTAEYAKKIAMLDGKSDDECAKAYYAALLHDVGLIGIPDSVIQSEELQDEDYEIIRQKPLIGEEILSSITEYPYLGSAARYAHEKYDGSGYPDGLKGDDIPEIARIVSVADAYVKMRTKKRYRDATPDFLAREAFVKGGGEEFDPVYSNLMVKIIDAGEGEKTEDDRADEPTVLVCDTYRDKVSKGTPVEDDICRISFECVPTIDPSDGFSAPSIILFDSFDARVHSDKRSIREYHYLEYGEIWFDDHMISTEARKMEVTKLDKKEDAAGSAGKGAVSKYEIVAARFEDHLKLNMTGPAFEKEVIVALLDRSRSAYIGLTGEHCEIRDISTESAGGTVGLGDIQRIAGEISYIDHIESDLKNVQIDRWRSASTEGVEIKNRLTIDFHTMTLPGASLVWQCPYIIIFSSDDGCVGGEGYHEYAVIKMNGENEGKFEYSTNRFSMKKKEDFPGWDVWREKNEEGIECEISIEKKGDRVIVRTENLGISIENTTTINEEFGKVYVALSGDTIALTDIRVKRH